MTKLNYVLLFSYTILLTSCNPYYDGKIISEIEISNTVEVKIKAYSEWEITVPLYVQVFYQGKLVGISHPFYDADPSILKNNSLLFNKENYGLIIYKSKTSVGFAYKSEPNIISCLICLNKEGKPVSIMPRWYKASNKMLKQTSYDEAYLHLKSLADEVNHSNLELPHWMKKKSQ